MPDLIAALPRGSTESEEPELFSNLDLELVDSTDNLVGLAVGTAEELE